MTLSSAASKSRTRHLVLRVVFQRVEPPRVFHPVAVERIRSGAASDKEEGAEVLVSLGINYPEE